MFKTTTIWIVIIFIFNTINISFWFENSEENRQNYNKYKENVSEYCENFLKINKEKKYIVNEFKQEKYNILDEDLIQKWLEKNSNIVKEVSKIYKKNMDNIYNCALTINQLNTLNFIKTLLKKDSKIYNQAKIESLKSTLNEKFINWNCNIPNNNNNTNIKPIVLNQAIYETCKYNYYLEYIKKSFKNIWVIIWNQNKEIENLYINNSFIASQSNKVIILVNEEIEKIYKIFPNAYKTYVEYENNFPIHFLLQILKNDFIMFRNELQKALHPINQVVYKIKDAMSK